MAKDGFKQVMQDFEGEPADLIPVLQRAQEFDGYLSAEAIRRISRWLKVSENEIYGVATFFAQFRFTPPGKHHIKVCLGTACHVQGGEQMLAVLERRLEIGPGETTADGEHDLERVACLGCCALAPVVTFDDKIYSQMSVLKLQGILDEREDDG
ncbi:MAG: NADH-quinone oxidoreductase subunit NuoE [Phycisphaerae bacterium]|nr:NADH-quinone oxidoreductase subunit NuoE [Phycisphaerae bacterium]